jgi:hypothetical protein
MKTADILDTEIKSEKYPPTPYRIKAVNPPKLLAARCINSVADSPEVSVDSF